MTLDGHQLAVTRLLSACSDADPLTEHTIRRLQSRYRLTEADLIAAWEAATGPGVKSPTRVAVSELRKRGEARRAA